METHQLYNAPTRPFVSDVTHPEVNIDWVASCTNGLPVKGYALATVYEEDEDFMDILLDDDFFDLTTPH